MKYGVLKIDEVEKYCSEESLRALDQVVQEISDGRARDGKDYVNVYMVVNTDEPYADEVRDLIEKHIGEEIVLE